MRVVQRRSRTCDVAEQLVDRWPAMRPFVLIGTGSVVVGGLVAAATRPLDLELGSWLAAFLVLVGGVAQIALGVGQAWLPSDLPPVRHVVGEVIAWNLGLVATITGSLLAVPVVTSAGGVATAVALLLFLYGTGSASGPRWAALAFRVVLIVVLVSTPIGLVLAWVRHG